MKKDDSPDSIKIFHGMKVVTILWVILNHTYYYLNYQALSSLLEGRQRTKDPAFQFVMNGFLNVETFFFISAVLIGYGVMKMKEERVNIFLYVFRRIWRLTPPFMLVIACVFLLPHLGSGPVWRETVVQGLADKCRANWWTNLLFVNNFVSSADMCLNWTWYIPVDTHLYFLSLLVIIPLKRNPRVGLLINAAILGVGTVITAAFHIFYKLHPTVISVYSHPDDIDFFVNRGYFRTYVHCSSYCVGLTVGYILATRQKIRISLGLNVLGWLVSFAMALLVLYGVYDWNLGNVPSLAVSTLYACTSKLVWSLALAWVTVACVTGHGGIATTILSWQGFVPLGRLTYMTYLVHPLIQFAYFGSTRTLIRMDHRTLVFLYLANVVLGFMCACALSLLFESPFMALEKVLFSARAPRDQKATSNEDVNKRNKMPQEYSGHHDKHGGVQTINIKAIEAS